MLCPKKVAESALNSHTAMQFVKLIHQLVVFLLEIGMLIILGMWGFDGQKTTLEKYGLGLGAPLLAACLWGIWAAPKSAYRLDLPYRLGLGVALFGLSAFLVYRLGHPKAALAFAITAITSALFDWFFGK